jgi:hypothetical protein
LYENNLFLLANTPGMFDKIKNVGDIETKINPSIALPLSVA